MGNAYDEQEEDMDEFEAEASEDEGGGTEKVAAEADDGPSSPAPRTNGEDSPEERTVSSRQKQREEMEREIEEFLARGGKISQIEPNVTADPPRKPDSDYGSRPI